MTPARTLVDCALSLRRMAACAMEGAEVDTHTQTSFPAIGAILIAQRTDDLVTGVRRTKGVLGARGGGGGAGRHFGADVSQPRPNARAQRSCSCFAASNGQRWLGSVMTELRACRELKLRSCLLLKPHNDSPRPRVARGDRPWTRWTAPNAVARAPWISNDLAGRVLE